MRFGAPDCCSTKSGDPVFLPRPVAQLAGILERFDESGGDIVEIATLRARADQTAKSFEDVGHKLDTLSDDVKKLLARRGQ